LQCQTGFLRSGNCIESAVNCKLSKERKVLPLRVLTPQFGKPINLAAKPDWEPYQNLTLPLIYLYRISYIATSFIDRYIGIQ
jgi:hypothetical protein